MAAAVNHKKLMTHELKAQIHQLSSFISPDRILFLQKGQVKPANEEEQRYLDLFEEMSSRGLGAACVPEPVTARTIRPVARLQQHHPQIASMASRQNIPHPVTVPNRMIGNH